MKRIISESGIPNNTAEREEPKGVKTLLGDPKKAIIKLSLPMIAAMLAQTVYNLVDAIWVSGLGADALAAIGFVFPFFFMAMAVSTGLGVGGGSAISRRIGERDKEGADNVAVHTIIITLIVAIAFTIPLFVFADQLFVMIGAAGTAGMASAYAKIIFAGTVIIFFTAVSNAILRGEGDAKRAMYVMILGAGLNIVLDPIFIYTLGLGIEGAAWATLVSMSISALIMLNWLFFKKDTYVSIRLPTFKFNKNIINDIFKVGLPASVQQLSMSIMMLILNIVIISIADNGTDGVAVYSTGWRVATIAILPLLGIATAVVSVTGAAFGARDFEKLRSAFYYAIKIGIIFETILAIALFLLAPYVTALFTTAEDAIRIAADLETFLMIICLFFPAVAFGIISSSMFQGTGKGINALIVTLLRTVVLTPIFALSFAIILGIGLEGIWLGIVVANIIGSIIAFLWAKLYIKNLFKKSDIIAETV